MCVRIIFDQRECPCVQCQQRSNRRYEHPASKRVSRLDPDYGRGRYHVSAEDLPSKIRVVNDECCGAERMAHEIGPVVARVSVPLKRFFEGMERGRCKASFVDIRHRTTAATIADTQKVEISRKRHILGDEWECIQAAAVVVDLTLNALQLCPIDVVPAHESQ